jgi:hypothetical protein
MAYDYAFLSSTMVLAINEQATSDQINQMLAPPLGRFGDLLSRSLPNYQGGGWEVVSHSTAMLDDHHLLLTVLLRRHQ